METEADAFELSLYGSGAWAVLGTMVVVFVLLMMALRWVAWLVNRL